MLCRVLCVLVFLILTAERNGDNLLYNGTWRSPLAFFAPIFDSIPGIRQPAWNLMLIGLAPICFLQSGGLRKRAWPMDAAILVSLLATCAWVIWGIARGGSAYMAYFQISAFLIGLVVAQLLLLALRNPDHLRAVAITVISAGLVRAVLALYYFLVFVRGREPYPQHVTTHDDSPLFVVSIAMLLSWAIVRRRWRTWALVLACALPLLAAMKVNNRRIAWIELVVALFFLYLSVPDSRVRRRVNRWLRVGVPILLVYVLVGWGRPGAFFEPLRAIDSVTGADQDASALARNEENLNLVLTFLRHPIVGTGWGHQFDVVSDYFAVKDGAFAEMYRFVPHNSLLGVVAFTGVVGLFATLCPLPLAAFLAARGARASPNQIERAGAMGAICTLPVFGLQTYTDLGLQSATNTVLLGVALAASGCIAGWTGGWPRASKRRRRQLLTIPAQEGVPSHARE